MTIPFKTSFTELFNWEIFFFNSRNIFVVLLNLFNCFLNSSFHLFPVAALFCWAYISFILTDLDWLLAPIKLFFDCWNSLNYYGRPMKGEVVSIFVGWGYIRWQEDSLFF